MELDIETIAVESFATEEPSTLTAAAAVTRDPVGTINTGPGGQYTLCYICTTYPE